MKTHLEATRELLPSGWVVIESDYDFCSGVISPDGVTHSLRNKRGIVSFADTKKLIMDILGRHE